jgi:hypothetical protein
MPQSWSQIKKMVEKAGVKDSDIIFMIDIGPDCKEIFIDRHVVSSKLTMVEISDDPILIQEEAPEVYNLQRTQKGMKCRKF